jgi:hypothetical protein
MLRRQQPFSLKKTNALKMERISLEENPEEHAGSKMGFGQADGIASLWRGLLATRRQGAWS